MNVSHYSPSPSTNSQQHGSHTKTAQKKRSTTRRKKKDKSVSCDVGSGEILIKEEAEESCVRWHSDNRLSGEVNKDSTEAVVNKRNKTDNETSNVDYEASIGGSG